MGTGGRGDKRGRVSWRGFPIHWQWHGDSNSPPHRRKLVDITAAKTLYPGQPNLVQVGHINIIKLLLDAGEGKLAPSGKTIDRIHIATAQFLVFRLSPRHSTDSVTPLQVINQKVS